MKSISLLGALGITVSLVAAAGVQLATASPNPACAVLDDPIYQAASATGSSLFTSSSTEAANAAAAGFSQNKGVAFHASTTAAPGLVGVHRLVQRTTKDYLFTISASEVSSAVTRAGYVDEGIRFYTLPTHSGCADATPRFVKGTSHRLAANAAEAAALTAAGWRNEGTMFWVAHPGTGGGGTVITNNPGTGTSFSFAVIPDTQQEVMKSTDTRLAQRNQWLVGQNVSFVTQTGDLVNWDTPAHEQYQRAKAGMNVLSADRTPYTVAVGNHDTAAVGVGGSAAPGKTWELVRDTRTLNSYFKASDFGNVAGAFEPGKIDNVYATYEAGGKKWMVLTLEFCARKSVIEWARAAVAAHPNHNVIISTHYYLTGSAGIGQDNAGYGETSPQYVYDRLIKQYPNIKMVFSGHVGYAKKARVDTGVNGNKVYSFLTTFHEGTTNPVRMLKVDTAKGTVSSSIYAPHTKTSYPTYTETISGLALK